MPYEFVPKSFSGYAMHAVNVYGFDEESGQVHIADRAKSPLTLTAKELAAARSRITSLRNRILTIEPPKKPIDLKAAVREGVRACRQGLLKPRIANFGLPAFRKWADLVNNPKDNKGWPRVFATGGEQLYAALKMCFACIETWNTPPRAFRAMYADFLEEAAEALGRPPFRKVATQYRELARQWSDLAAALLPESRKPFKRTRELMLKKNRLLEERGVTALAEIRAITEELDGIKEEMTTGFPMTRDETLALFGELEQRLRRLTQLEESAAGALGEYL